MYSQIRRCVQSLAQSITEFVRCTLQSPRQRNGRRQTATKSHTGWTATAVVPESLERRTLLAAGPIMDESVFDADLFAQNLLSTYGGGNSVGFAASINVEGSLNAKTATGGFARTGNDSLLGFDTDTRTTIASVAKTITATAILKILQDQGLSLDESVSSHLPSDWFVGPNVGGITFRDVLTHRSGFRLADSDGDGTTDTGLVGQTFYTPLSQAVAAGINGTDADGNGLIDVKEQFDYENANFALMRVALGYLWNGVQDNHIDNGNVLAMRSDVRAQVLSDWGTYFVGADQLTASIYKSYVKNFVLEPMGIQNADTKPTGPTSERAFHYPLGTTPISNTDGFTYGDRTLFSGGEGWYLSAAELSRFFHYITNTNLILRQPMRDEMQSQFLGLNGTDDWSFARPELFDEPYLMHGGDLSNSAGEANTGFAAFPNNVQAALLINSAVAPGRGYQLDELADAWENAWTEITIGGLSGDDTFDVRLSQNRRRILVDLNGQRVASLNAFVVKKLTLKGYRGQDTFNILSLPHSVDLVAMGSSGDDTLNVSSGNWNIEVQGDVTFDGGTGSDSLVINDIDGPSGSASYNLLFRTVTRSGFAGDVAHYSVEELTLNTGNSDNDIRIASIPGESDISVNSGSGDDTILVENALVASGLTVDGGSGDDGITFRNSTVFGTVSLAGGRGVDTIEAENSSLRGILRLSGNEQSDSIVATDLSLSPDGRLSINGDSGSDTIRALRTFGQAGSSMSLSGGSSGDTLIVNDVSGDVSTQMFGDAGKDSVRVYESDLSIPLYAYGGTGNDFIRLGGGDISRRLNGIIRADGGTGNDHIVLEDRVGTGANDFYVFSEGLDAHGETKQFFNKTGLAGLFEYTDAETITLKGTQQASTTNVRAVPWGTTLNINVVGGDDVVRIHESDPLSTINIKGGNGNDIVTVSPEDRNLDLVRGVVNFRGQAGGGDKLHLLDDNSTGESTLQIGATTFRKDDRPQWTHFDLEQLTLQANDHDNTLHLDGVMSANEVIVNMNGGNDDVFVAEATRDLDTAIRGDLTIRAGDHNGRGDRIYLRDQNDQIGDDSYTINNVYFQKNTTERWLLSGFEHHRLFASQNSNAINVDRFGSFSSDHSWRIFGNGGDDVLTVGSGFNRTTFILDDIHFTGGTGDDIVRINDRSNNSNGIYTLNTGEIDLGQLKGRVTYSSVSNVEIGGGMRNDTFHVESNAANVDLYLGGNSGSDTFNIAEPSEDMDNVPGEIILSGESTGSLTTDIDTVNVYDANGTGPDRYTINAPTYIETRIAKGPGSFIQYTGIDTSFLAAGRGDNRISIPWITEGQDLTVHGGPGNDTFLVGAIETIFAVRGSITLRGGGGSNDRLTVTDNSANADAYTVTRSSVRRADILPVRYFGMDKLFLSVNTGDNLVNVRSTNPNTTVVIGTGDGDDHVRIIRPSSRVNVFGGANGAAGDRVTVIGGTGNDTFRVYGESISRDSAVVQTFDVEQRVINGVAGNDQVIARGTVGTDEVFRVTPRATQPNSGHLRTGVYSNVLFVNVPNVRVNGNSTDNDRLVFAGTNSSDQFHVNMAAVGNMSDPYLKFTSVGGAALTLLGYGGVGTPRLLGRNGADTFDIYVADRGPSVGRRVRIIGGNSPRSLTRDRLNLHYPRREASVTHVPTDSDTGTIDALFATRRFDIDYDEFESVLLLPL